MTIEKIKERFENTGYRFGFKTEDNSNEIKSIAYGNGWGQLFLKMILIDIKENTISYEFSCATNCRLDQRILLPLTDDFSIPKVDDFKNFIFDNKELALKKDDPNEYKV